jgi:hypothetical protein
MMFILPNGKIIKHKKSIILNGIHHSSQLFDSVVRYAKYGIKEYREQPYNKRFYRPADVTYVTEGNVVTKTYNLQPKYTDNQIKQKMNKKLKSELIQLYNQARKEYNFAADMETQEDANVWLDYMNDLKTAYQTIKAEVLPISDYETLIAYSWADHIPPFPED